MSLFLIIDEDRDSGDLARRMLMKRGHRVTAFTRTEEALKWFSENAPDLILLSAGKYGAKAGVEIKTLETAGIHGADIVLCADEGSLGDVKKAFGKQVREVLIKISDFEKLENLVISES